MAGTPDSRETQDIEGLQVKLDNLKLLLEVHKNKHSSSNELGVALDLMTKMYNSNKKGTTNQIIKMDIIYSLQDTNNSYTFVHKTLSYYNQHMNELAKRVATDKFVDIHDSEQMKALKYDIFLFEQVFHTLKLHDRFEFANLYKLSNNDIGTFSDLVNFIDLKTINEVEFSNRPHTTQHSSPLNLKTFASGKIKDGISCAFGCKHGHTTIHCNRFDAADVKKRHTMAREVNLCKKCLKGTYPHSGCVKSCKVCNGGHHELLHFGNTP